MTSKKIQNKKKMAFLKKILTVLFPVECFKFFHSQPIKKMTNELKNQYLKKHRNQNQESSEQSNKDDPEKLENLKNSLPQFESDKKLRRYQSMSVRAAIKKKNRSTFILSRTDQMSADDFTHFEHCKEEKFCSERQIKHFLGFIKRNSCLSLEEISTNQQIVQLISYILNC